MIKEDRPWSLVLTVGSPEIHTLYMAEPSDASDESYIPLDTPSDVSDTEADTHESANPAHGSQRFLEPLLASHDDVWPISIGHSKRRESWMRLWRAMETKRNQRITF